MTECMDKFKSLCRPSFTPRKFYGIPGLGALVEAHHHSKYETKPLEEALMGTFSHGNLFGGHKLGDQHTTKVAVVATRAAGLKAVVLSNYNRTGEDDKCEIILASAMLSVVMRTLHLSSGLPFPAP